MQRVLICGMSMLLEHLRNAPARQLTCSRNQRTNKNLSLCHHSFPWHTFTCEVHIPAFEPCPFSCAKWHSNCAIPSLLAQISIALKRPEN